MLYPYPLHQQNENFPVLPKYFMKQMEHMLTRSP